MREEQVIGPIECGEICNWEPIGGENCTGPTRLLGEVEIMGRLFHAEAVEVMTGSDGQMARSPEDQDLFDKMRAFDPEGSFVTIRIPGTGDRHYVLFITPHLE